MKKSVLALLLMGCCFLAFPGDNEFAIEGFRKAISEHPDYRIYYLSILSMDCSEAIAASVASKTGKDVTIRKSMDRVNLSEVEKEKPLFLNIGEWHRGTQFHTFMISVWDGNQLNKLLTIEIEVSKDGRVVGSAITEEMRY